MPHVLDDRRITLALAPSGERLNNCDGTGEPGDGLRLMVGNALRSWLLSVAETSSPMKTMHSVVETMRE